MTIGIGNIGNDDSYMRNCVIMKRASDGVIVVVRENRDVAVRLDGYVIMPNEDYLALQKMAGVAGPCASGPVRNIVDAQ